MARLVITGIPHPPENEVWCAACLALAKGEAMSDPELQKRIMEGLADETQEVFVVAVNAKEFLKALDLAVSIAGTPLIMRGALAVPLCAVHFPAIDPAAPSPGPPRPGQQSLYRGGSPN